MAFLSDNQAPAGGWRPLRGAQHVARVRGDGLQGTQEVQHAVQES